jgi:hypothetical protein
MLKMLQLKLWPIIVHRNAVPEKQLCEITTIDTQRNKYKPYRVQSILQSPLPCLPMDKILHNLQLHFIATFESARVVENVTSMAREAQFMLDVVLATLYKRDPYDRLLPRRISLPYLLARTELLNLMRMRSEPEELQ